MQTFNATQLNTSKKPFNYRMVGAAALLAFSFSSLQAHAVGTEDDMNQAPLISEFNKLDSDQNEKLSRQESAKDKDLVGQFDQADSNKDGVLIAEEYTTYKSAVQQKRVELYLDDSTVTAKVKTELLRANGMQGLNISVETFKGQVILSGFVKSGDQAKRAGEIAASVAGVTSVKNALVVKG